MKDREMLRYINDRIDYLYFLMYDGKYMMNDHGVDFINYEAVEKEIAVLERALNTIHKQRLEIRKLKETKL